jgi:hypothetical protein
MPYQPSKEFKSLLREICETNEDGVPDWIINFNDQDFSNRLSYWESFVPNIKENALNSRVVGNGRYQKKRILPADELQSSEFAILREFGISAGEYFIQIETYGFHHIVYVFENLTVLKISTSHYLGEMFLVPVEGMLPMLCITGIRIATSKKYWNKFIKNEYTHRLRVDGFDHSFAWNLCQIRHAQLSHFSNTYRGLHERVREPLKIGDYLLQKGVYDDALFKEAELFVMHLTNYVFLCDIGVLKTTTTFQEYIQELENNPHMIPLVEGTIIEIEQAQEVEVETVQEDFTHELRYVEPIPEVPDWTPQQIIDHIRAMTLTTTSTSTTTISMADLEALNSTNS